MKNYVNKLLKTFGFDIYMKQDAWSNNHLFSSGNKKWLGNILPSELLNRNLKQAVESLITINESGVFYKNFPMDIHTPNYGDRWGRIANYIEINNRAIAEMHGNIQKMVL